MPDPPVVDVARLVEDLRARAARAGDDGEDVTRAALRPPAPAARVRFRPELGYSSKPLLGRPLTALKRLILRLLVHVFDDLAAQADAAVGRVEGEVRHVAAEAASERDWTRAALADEAAVRERTQGDVGELATRVSALESTLERLQLAPRLARLERRRTGPATAPPATSSPPLTAPPAASEGGIDYLAFEARFRGSEEAIRARQEVYRDRLADRRRVVDLGCGRGELLELLADLGVEGYGVELEPDFVALAREKGLDVRREDALAHLEGLEAGEVDGVVASHVVEHLPPTTMARLVATAADRLPEGGLLVLETPNPESLLAGSVNFHRDPTHLRPVHPDTLAFLCESAGFADVAVERLARVPDAHRLPVGAPGEVGLARHVDAIAERLNELIYGWQDYAIVARR